MRLFPALAAPLAAVAALTAFAARPAAAQSMSISLPDNNPVVSRPNSGTQTYQFIGTVDLGGYASGVSYLGYLGELRIRGDYGSFYTPGALLSGRLTSGFEAFLMAASAANQSGTAPNDASLYLYEDLPVFEVDVDGTTELGTYEESGYEMISELRVDGFLPPTEVDGPPEFVDGTSTRVTVTVIESAAAPEPGSLALLALPLAGAVAARRRRRAA